MSVNPRSPQSRGEWSVAQQKALEDASEHVFLGLQVL